MPEPKVGQPAPEFNLPSTAVAGTTALLDLRGKKVVIAFYINDFTGG